jgi:hypothetical protein
MSSSTRADTHDVPQWPFYFLARLVTVLHFGALSDRCTFTLTDARATDLRHDFCCEGLVVIKEVLSLALCVYLLLLEMSWPSSSSSRSNSIKQKLVLQLQMLQQQPECVLQELKLSPPYLYCVHCTSSAWKFWSIAGFI